MVIEVKRITGPVDGVLSSPVQGPWSLPGIEGDPVALRHNDINPLDQAREGVFLARTVAAECGNRQAFILGLVLVLPQVKHILALDRGRGPSEADLRVTTLEDLHRWFQRYGEVRPVCWTAEQVHEVLSVLNFAQSNLSWRGDPYSWIGRGISVAS